MDNGQLFHTGDHRDADQKAPGWAIFVMAPDGKIYAHSKTTGRFHHSSFLAGGPVKGGGTMMVDQGEVVALTPASGHYKPGREQVLNVLRKLFGHYRAGIRDFDEATQEFNKIKVTDDSSTQGGVNAMPWYGAYEYLTSGQAGAQRVAAPPATLQPTPQQDEEDNEDDL
jgi:hypothetical protein